MGTAKLAWIRLCPILVRYGLALMLVSSGIAASMLLRQYGSNRPFLIFLFASVLASGWFCGTGAGWFAVVVATVLVDYYYIPPRFHVSGDARDIPWLLSFVACAAVGNILAARQRRARTLLQEARDTLEQRVTARTAELERANHDLKAEMHERERAEADLREARIELERVARLTTMGELTATIAHEISQPLASIGVNATAAGRWIDASPPNLSETQAALRRIERDHQRATEIVGRIRAIVRRARPVEEPVDVNGVIWDVLNVVYASFSAAGIKVSLSLAEPSPRALGDRVALQQVVMNLVLNAKDAMMAKSAGARTLTVQSRTEASGSVLVGVQDTGPGIRAEVRDKIFAPFFTTTYDGLGLGLSICKSIIQQHGGRISVESGDAGTTFTFALPAIPVAGTLLREGV